VSAKQPREVAGLGRPETPAEKNERVTTARAERRSHQTALNLVWSLLVSLGVVALLVVVVVRPDTNLVNEVDWRSVAEESADALPGEPLAPFLYDLWTSNRAEIFSEPGTDITWSIGLLGPENSYVSFDQGFGADASWVAGKVEQSPLTGEVLLGLEPDTVTWEEYDRTAFDAGANNAYVLSVELAESIIVIAGNNKRAVEQVAEDVSFQISAPGGP
jgi:hypothetical protein